MDHLYSLPYGAGPPADSVSEMTPEVQQPKGEELRLLRDRMQAKTRVNIGFAFPRWRALRTKLGIRKDAELALVLLESLSKKKVQEEAGIDPQNPVINCKDSWETASEESASDEDCAASISLRLCSRPADDSDGRGERTEEE
ncbi:uncharacterized protein si:ch211-40k21.5 isoform X1 [Pleuronectes platessa]|nr:uncharacterized protein si:ch211-40k21.5 isoform X1 [Pleuronectes platessa]